MYIDDCDHGLGGVDPISRMPPQPDTKETAAKIPSATKMTDDEYAVLCFRTFIYDICMQNGGGHAGSAVGMAAIGVALWKYIMRFNPADPNWFDRDRFVLSNGHTSMFLYAMNHLVGYDAWTKDEIKGYGNAKLNGYKTIAHAHPEIEVPGVEVTTGPLGQGIANAVGLAIASKNLAANFNKPGYEIVQSRIYCMTGDGCLMEGVALEAISLAGHLQLNNLVLLYDNNSVTCDGPLDWINTEDINAKMRATGWEVLDVFDGDYDVQQIVSALQLASGSKSKPVFINIRTTIGLGTSVAGTYKAHHGPFDKDSITKAKQAIGIPTNRTHHIPERALQYFRERRDAGAQLQKNWNRLLQYYSSSFPQSAAEFHRRQVRDLIDADKVLDAIEACELANKATRQSNGMILEKLWNVFVPLCGGGADLVNSNQIKYADTDVFQASSGHTGRYIRNGIREHAMAAVANGLAAYGDGVFVPVTATFLMFYLYAAPGVRMGALSGLQVIHIATHDSFAEGQNGPTHQPVEVDSLYRAMPNLTYIRPCDGEELVGSWKIALHNTERPTFLSLARDVVPSVTGTNRNKVRYGAYILRDVAEADLTLLSCGSNLHYCVAAANRLEQKGLKTRIVSFPSMDLFQSQSEEYRNSVLPLDGKPIISVEEYVATAWARYATASIGMTSYGYSASNESNYRRFELDAEGIEKRVLAYLDKLGVRDARQAGWQQI